MSTVTLQLEQASSAFTLTNAHALGDFLQDLDHSADVVSFTEVAEHHQQLADACDRKGYRLVLPTEGDCAVAVRSLHTVTNSGTVPSVPGRRGPASEGGHGPRPVLWATFVPFGTREHVTVHSAHWVTRKADVGHQQLQLTEDLADAVRDHSRGPRLGFWLGDTNNPDRGFDITEVDRALRKGELTSCWDELGRYPDTHEGQTIDVVGSYDPDTRVSCLRARRWHKLNSDHLAVSAWYTIQRVRAR